MIGEERFRRLVRMRWMIRCICGRMHNQRHHRIRTVSDVEHHMKSYD
jgi:hypothetical protein